MKDSASAREAPRVCIIGAGSSGLPCIKALKDAGIPVACYEAGSGIGGNWRIDNDNGMSSAYESLHINTSRPRMQYADFPMPADYPDFPGHRAICRYFESYAERFDLTRHIRFRRRVTRVEGRGDGRWTVETDAGEEVLHDAVLVANGHHWKPRWPDPPIPGEFAGETLHSHHYRNPTRPLDLRGKRVLVIGMGNSAMDIACELARPGLSERVVLCGRRPSWVIPKYLFGKPLDQAPQLPWWLPWRLRSAVASLLLKLAAGRLERFGLPRPDHPLFSAHPTISQELYTRLGSGDLSWRPGPSSFAGSTVRFGDGSREDFDAVIFCTGYSVSFPFLPEDLLPVRDNEVPLWLHLAPPDLPGLYFIGLMQPLGAIMPLAEAQAKLLADHLAGHCLLPDPGTMRRELERERERTRRRYLASPRHTMQVDFDEYLRRLQRAHRAGSRMARSSPGHSFWARMDLLNSSAA